MAANVQLGRLPAQAIALLYLGLFPLVGMIVAYIGFCDPDTCWHLAMGKWMCVHNQLPLADPFSTNINDFVLIAKGQPIMQHEWLSDCILYKLYDCGGAKTLLVFVAAFTSLSLIISPSLLLVKSGAARLVALTVTICGLPACLFRMWVRPEIFSCAYLSALIWLVETGRRSTKTHFLLCLLATFALLALWANCHALFVLGLFYLLFYTTLLSVQLIFSRSEKVPTGAVGSGAALGRLAALAAAGIMGSLCTPWQANLWLYLLNIIFSPQAHANKENGPLDFYSMWHVTAVPLVVTFVFVAFLFVKLILHKNKSEPEAMQSIPLGQTVVACGLYLSGLAIAVLFRRLTPFALLILFNSLAVLYDLARSAAQTSKYKPPENDGAGGAVEKEGPRNWIDACRLLFDQLRLPGLQSSVLGVALAISTTLSVSTYLIRPEIPSSSPFFAPACQALISLSEQRPGGRMLNDSKLGSMMTFCMAQPPDLFIDGRFDSYSRQLIDDYQQMRLAKPGYQDLLRHYKIDWVFFPPETPLVDRLREDPDWHVFYQDAGGVVLSRTSD